MELKISKNGEIRKIKQIDDKMLRRGALIVFEGCDRVGKTTQIQKLADTLIKNERKVKVFKFPERSTIIGKLIDEFLQKKKQLDDHVVHLLFSANRWECIDEIKKQIESGTTVLIDRYAYSGIAYSSAKETVSYKWCMNTDAGLPRPDLVVYLEWSNGNLTNRNGFGDEIYENTQFQNKVKANYDKLKTDSNWKVFDCQNGIDEVHTQILESVNQVLDSELDDKLPGLFTEILQ